MILTSLLKGTDWSEITEYLSPVFFQVVSPLAIASQIKALSGAYLDQPRFARVCKELSPALREARLPVPIPAAEKGTTVSPAVGASTAASAQQIGEDVLKLYFWQLFQAPTVILDLRAKAFPPGPLAAGAATSSLSWRPDPLYITYDQEFIAQVRQLYAGFYQGDDAAFTAALTALNLAQAKDLFLQHFGQDQSHQRFRLADFRSTFHQIFVSCKQAKARLQPNFLAFGAGLFCLYEHLERLDVALDVRAAFFAASGLSPVAGLAPVKGATRQQPAKAATAGDAKPAPVSG